MNNSSFEIDPQLYIFGWVMACNNKAPRYATILNVSKRFGLDQSEAINTIDNLVNSNYIKTCFGDNIKKNDAISYLCPDNNSSWTSSPDVKTLKDLIETEFFACGLKIIRILMTTSGATSLGLMEAITEYYGGTVLVAIDKALENEVIRLGDNGELHITKDGLKIYSGIGK